MQRIEVVNGVDWIGAFLRETLESNGCMMSCMPPHFEWGGNVNTTSAGARGAPRVRSAASLSRLDGWTCSDPVLLALP